jgi:uncharacterized membrane protein
MPYYHSNSRRVVFLDELRGLSILLMVVFHGAYDLVYIFGVDIPIFHSEFLQRFLQPFFAGVFILISGIVCRYSRSNLKRGLTALGLGLVMTLVTWRFMPGQLILFGILHLLGVCMILYGLSSRENSGKPDRLPAFGGAALFGLLFALTWNLPNRWLGFPGTPLSLPLPDSLYRYPGLSPLGFFAEGFASADYFPLMPWLFLFFAGSFIGVLFHAGAMPEFFYRSRFPFLAKAGRHTLVIYLLHQPVVYGVMWGVFWVLGRLFG